MKVVLLAVCLGWFALASCHHSGKHSHSHPHSQESSCTHSHEEHSHKAEDEASAHQAFVHEADDHEHDHEASANQVVISPEKAHAAGVRTRIVQPESFRQVIRVSGDIESLPDATHNLVATVSGMVSFSKNHYPGEALKKGEALLYLSTDHLQEGDPLAMARVRYEAAKEDYERASRLLADQIVSQKDYTAIRENYEQARLHYEALSQQQSDQGWKMVAPIDGYLSEILVANGDYVEVGQVLARINQTDRLQLKASVPERYLPHIQQIVTAHFKTAQSSKIYQLDSLNGRLLSRGKTLESFYLPLYFSFDNDGSLVPGSYAEVYLIGKALPQRLVLPHTALVEEQGLFFVYVKTCQDSYRKQEVSLGGNDGIYVEILSGISAGDEVVYQGASRLKLASASQSLPAHSHSH